MATQLLVQHLFLMLKQLVVLSASVGAVVGHTQSSLQVISPGEDPQKGLTYMLWLDAGVMSVVGFTP